MFELFKDVTKSLLDTTTEKFGGARVVATSSNDALASLISFVIIYTILLFVGKFLWNEYLVKYVTIFKPIPGVIELIAISVLVRLFLA